VAARAQSLPGVVGASLLVAEDLEGDPNAGRAAGFSGEQ
jgi:hypothetical protein